MTRTPAAAFPGRVGPGPACRGGHAGPRLSARAVMGSSPGPLQGCSTGRRRPAAPRPEEERMRMRLIAPLTAALVAGTVGLSTTAAVAAPAPAAPAAAP